MTLPDMLDTRRKELVESWLRRVEKLLAPRSVPREVLLDNLPAFLEDLAATVRCEDTKPPGTSQPCHGQLAAQHGVQRLQQGFDVAFVVREYALLRDCILEVLEQEEAPLSARHARLLAQGIDLAAADALSAFVREEQLRGRQAVGEAQARQDSAEGLLAEVRRAEAARRESEEQFRLLVETTRDYSVFMVSPEGRVASWNLGAQRLKGYGTEEILGSHISIFFPRRQVEGNVTAHLLAAATAEGRSEYEGWLVRKDGGTFWGTVALSAVRDEEGHLRGFSNVARDLTARKQTEWALRESEESLRLLIDSVTDYSIFMLTPEGKVGGWNPGAERLKGYRAEEILGSHLSVFFPASDVEKGVPEGLLARATTEGRAEYEGTLVRKDRSTFWGSVIFTPVKDEQGRLRGISNVARDITERKWLEHSHALLSEAGAVLAGALDGQPLYQEVARLATRRLADWCVVSLLKGQTLQPVFVAHVDETKEGLARKSLRDVDATSHMPHGVAHVVRTGQPERCLDASEAAWVEQALGLESAQALQALGARSYMCVPLKAQGKTFGAMTFVSTSEGRRYGPAELDLAEELAYRSALAVDNARLYREAQEAVRARDELISMASHDLRAPLSAIRLNVQLLMRGTGAAGTSLPVEQVATRMKALDRQMGRMVQMLDTLLDVSRMAAGHLELNREPVELSSLAREVAAGFAEEVTKAGGELRLRADAPVKGHWDPLRLEQVMANLLSNALKYGRGQPVEVAVEVAEGVARLTVRDHGVGIAPEDQERLFDRFERVKPEKHVSGFGVGLWIVHRIVEAHGGTIRVASQQGVGSTFTVELPLT